VVGHFGTYGSLVAPLLTPVLARLLTDCPVISVQLLGRGGERYREELVRGRPAWAARVSAAADLSAPEVAARLRACALVVQPYPDGVSSRRTSVMAALANGVPVVTTFGFLSESFWKEVLGAALADPNGLADAASRMLADPGRRAALGRAGWELYERRFALRHTIDALLDS
jgi:glycosyltransferase involved in cell wall biosynthesis